MHVSLVKAGRVFLNVTALLSVFLSSGNVYSQTATGPVSSTQMASGVSLTIQEQEFLRNNPVITVAIDRSVPPIEFRDENGDNIGLSIDYLKELSEKLGVKFDIRNFTSRPKAHDAVLTGKADMFAAVIHDEMGDNMACTKPYLSLPIVIYTTSGHPYVHDISELEDKTIALVMGSSYMDSIKSRYPSLHMVYLANASDALSQLTSGKIDAFLGDMLTTGLKPGSMPGKLYMKMDYSTRGKSDKLQTPESAVNIGVLEEIKADVPKVAKSGVMGRNSLCLADGDVEEQKALANYLQKLGYNFYYDGPAQKEAPKGLERWSEGYNIWHVNNGLVHLRDAKVGVGNGFEVYLPSQVEKTIPDEIRYINNDMKPRRYAISPWALYGKHPWVVENVLKPISKDIEDGRYTTLWSNWEPFMFMENGDFSDGSKKEFIKWSGLPAKEVEQLWPNELIKRYPEKWRDFRNWELGQGTKVLAETVHAAAAKVGKNGYFAVGTVSDYLTEIGQIVDYKKWDDFPYIYQTWTYHLGPSSIGPYPNTDRSGAPIVQRVGAVAEQVDKLWKNRHKPLLSCIYGTTMYDLQGCSEYHTPERNAFMQLSTIMAGMDVVSNYAEWPILDGRYASEIAKANTRIAYWDEFILKSERQRKHVVIPVSPYPETVPLHVAPEEQQVTDWASPRYLMSFEYKKGNDRLFAVANTWDDGECFFRLRVLYLDEKQKYILSEPETHRIFANDSGQIELTADDLKKGLVLHVGGIRWGAFLLVPAGEVAGKLKSYKTITPADIQKVLDSRLDKLYMAMKENERLWGADRKAEVIATQLTRFVKPLSRLAIVKNIATAPRVDGVLDDTCWKDAEVYSDFNDKKFCEPAKYPTAWRAVLHDGVLYLAIECKQDMRSTVNNAMGRDGRTWCDDSVEILVNSLNPVASWDYLQVIVNTSSTVFDAYKNDRQWNGIDNVVAKQNKDGWSVELAIPLKECFPGETALRVNLVRAVQISEYNKAEISSWFPVSWQHCDMSSRGVLIFK